MKKYEITNESIEFEGKTLYRIKAMSDFDDVKAGDVSAVLSNVKITCQIAINVGFTMMPKFFAMLL